MAADPAPEEDRKPRPTRRHWAWLVLLGVAFVELVGHYVVQARVVEQDDWQRAAERVREEWQDDDLIVAAPEWTDPLLRRELGDLIGLPMAGRDGTDGYARLWTISARGHLPAEAPDSEPELDEAIGPLRVLRWPLEGPRVLYRFSEHVQQARASIRVNGSDRPCRWQDAGRPRGGGLGQGPIVPAARHVCDPRRNWLWVGVTMQDTLSLEPRHCIWTHPAGAEPIRVSFASVPLGDELVLGGDYYYEHERNLEHGPTRIRVFVDGEAVGTMTHNDGDGWKRMVASTRVAGRSSDAGEVSIEVTADNPDLRTFCWNAYTREAGE